MKPAPGVNLKLSAARSKLKAFQRSLDRFVAREPYEMRPQEYVNRTDPTLYQWSLRVFRKKGVRLPTSSWSRMLDELTYHLRSALDAAVFDLSTTAQRPDPSSTGFPIAFEQRNFDRKLIRYLSKQKRAFVKGVQPYGRPNDLLWVLHQINRRNKHRLMHFSAVVVALDQQGIDRNLEISYSDLDLVSTTLLAAHRGEDGAEFIKMVYRKSGPKPGIKVHMKLQVDVMLGDRLLTLDDSPAGGLMSQIAARVEDTIATLYSLP